MTELTRLVRPAQPQVGISPSPKERHAEGIKYPIFRQLNKKSRILLSPHYLSTDQNYAYRYLVVSNKKGWFAAVQNSAGVFGAVLSPLSDLRKSLREATRDNYSFTPQRTLSFSTSEPNVLALACNDSRLIVGFKSGQVIAYDTSSVFTSGSNEITPLHVLQSSQQPILDILPNPNAEDPNLSNVLVVLRGDGTVQVLNSSLEAQGGWATTDADSVPVAAAWSPKGKQLAIGLRFGDILTFTLDNKSTPQRHIPPTTQGSLTSLAWLAPGHTFRTTYAASQPIHHIVYSDKRTTPIIWTELEYSYQIPDRNRQNSYLAVLPKWDDEADDRLAILAGDVACTDLEIIGNIGNEWYQQSQENPLSIPLDKKAEDTVLLSLQVDLTDTDANEGGYPIVYAYLNDGTLQGWFVDHPERKPYAGMFGTTTNSTANQVAPSPFSQPQQNSAFGSQPASSSSFGQSSAFGSQQTGTPFGQAATPAFGQTGFGQATSQPTAFGSSTSSGNGFAGFTSNSGFGGGSFGSSAPDNTSSFGNTSTVASAPQITRDDSMSDSTTQSSFGGLSLGEGSDESSKPKSVFGGGGGVFGSPSPLPLPPNHPSNQTTSAFGSGSGSFIKPATGFGAFGNSGGSFGAFGSNTTTGAFSGGAFSAKPSQSSAFASTDDQPKSGPAFGQSSFGQSSFGKPSFGQPSFGQSSFGMKPAVTSGAFSAFAQSGPTSFASAATPAPASNGGGGGGGFASFAGNGQSGFNAPAKTVFGGSAMNAAEDKSTLSGGNNSSGLAADNKPASPFGSQSSTASGGAFSNFSASGPSVFGQPATSNGGAFGGLKSESPSVFGQPAPAGAGGAFGGFKTESPSVFGQSSSTSAFGGLTKPESADSVSGKPAPSSSNAAGGPKSESPSVFGQSGSASTEGAFGGLKRSESANSVFGSPASSSPFGGAFGAMQPTTTSDSDATKPADAIKSEPISPNLPSSPESDAPSPTPTPSLSPAKASTAPSGGAFGNLQTSTSAFKPATGFGAFGSAIPSSSPFLQAKTSGDTLTVSAFGNLSAPKTAFPAATSPSSTGPTFGSTSKLGFGFALNKPASVTPPATESTPSSAAVKKERDDDVLAATPENQSEGKEKAKAVELSKDEKKDDDAVLAAIPESRSEGKGKDKAVGLSKDDSHESISSASSSFVEVDRSEDHEEDEEVEVPDSDGDFEGNQQGDEDDFLSESYGSQSGDEDEQSEEDEEHSADIQSEEAPSSPEPTEIPLPPSRSRSNTPQAETPQTDPSSDDSDSSHLSTIREESTTPPGSPAKPQKPPVIIAPSPINLPSSLPAKHNTRPTRSSPLASKPLVGLNEVEEEREAKPTTLKPRPASPKTPFGVLPPKSRSTSPEDSKLPDNKRPKTPPLLSMFGSSSPSTPKPAAATLPSFVTPSKPPLNQTTPLLNTPVTGLSPLQTPPPSSGNIFGKPFSLGPPTSGTDPAPLKAGNVFSPPPSNLFGSTTPKPEARMGVQPSLTSSGPQPGLSPGAPKMVSPSPSPFAVTSTGASPSSFGAASPMRPPPAMPSMEEGMQKECLVLVQAMHRELNNLREMAAMVAKRREELSQSAGGSRRKEDLCIREKWALSDSAQFGVVLRLFEQDISELKEVTEKQREELRDLGKSMIKAGTRREEIARFNKAKSDNEFSKMLKSRTLGPEHLENQTQLRRDIRALRNKVDQLEDQLRAHKKRLSEVNSGRPTLKPPSLDTINRTYRNIDIALQQQVDMVEQLNGRFLKLKLDVSPPNFPAARDPRLPAFTSRSRPSIITPDVAVTTAAALNAERSAHKLKMMLLRARKEPLLNVKANEGGRKVPTAYSTPKPSHGIAAMTPGAGLQFNTPIIQGPLFAAAAASPEPGSWDTMSFPEDNFRPSAPISSAGRRGGTPQRKHGSAAPVKKSPALGSPDAPKVPSPASFDWGPLPTFKPSQGLPLPGFDKVMSGSPSSSPSQSRASVPPQESPKGNGKGKGRAVEPISASWVSEGF